MLESRVPTCLYHTSDSTHGVSFIISSIHGVASHLRVLWACIRWDDLATKPPAGGTNTTSTETDITTREVLERRDVPPNNLRSEFKIRSIVIPLDFMENPNRTGMFIHGYSLGVEV